MSSIFADLLTNHHAQSSHFYINDDDEEEDNDLSTLPFPLPLSRPTFSSATFDTETFLLSHSQFRTPDDLRAELRQWVDKLSDEMETLIGEDWQGYLSLGRGLAGGEQSVRDAERRVRAMEREVQTVKRRIEERMREVDGALREKKRIRKQADFARRMLAIHSSLQTLEKGLLLSPDDNVTNDEISLYSPHRLQRLLSQYRKLSHLIDTFPHPNHPFLTSQHPRLEKVRTQLKRDLHDTITHLKSQENTLETFNLLLLTRSTDIPIFT